MINSVSNYNCQNKSHSNPTFGGKWISPKKGQAYVQSIKDTFAKIIYTSGHSSMDNDALCSELFLSRILKSQGINALVCAKSEQLNTLYMHKSKEIHRRLKKVPDLILTVDFNDILKIPKLLANMFEGKGNKISEHKSGLFEGTNIIGIDHRKNTKTIKGNYYIDDSAQSCCGILVRLADALGYKMSREDAKIAYCGMLSDYQKKGLVEIENGQLIKTPVLFKDKNSRIVLEKVEKLLDKKDKAEIHNYIDVMSRLTRKEKSFLEKLKAMVQIEPNGKFAYVAIDPQDKDWAKIGMDNDTTSTLLRHFRKETLKNSPELKAVAIFYRTSPKDHGVYRVSLHSKDGYAHKLLKKAETLSGTEIGNGPPDRPSGSLASLDKTETDKFINYFVEAAKEIE